MQFSVLFENNEYICVDKPALVLTVPARLGESETRPVLGQLLEKQLQVRLWPVHRLDEPVSGAVLFAKSGRAHSIANSWFEKNLIGKTYEAYTLNRATPQVSPIKNQESKFSNKLIGSGLSHQQGLDALVIPEPGQECIWQAKLLRGKKRAYIDETRGKLSITLATLVEQVGEYYYWHLKPKTGRPHQLRFELFRHHHPILGDVLYGGETWLRPGIALRNLRLDFSNCPEAGSFGLPTSIEAPVMERPK